MGGVRGFPSRGMKESMNVSRGWWVRGIPSRRDAFTPEAWERIARGAKRPRVRVGKG